MTQKFYITRTLPEYPEEEPWNNGHHNVPQQYLETILKQKIPDSELINSNSQEISKLLSKGSLEVEQKEREEHIKFEQAKKYLMKEFESKIYYIRKNQSISRSNDFENPHFNYIKEKCLEFETEVKRAMYKKYADERTDFKQCLNWWIEEEDSILAKLETERFPIKSDISGIIIPIAHADWCDLPHIISDTQGNFKDKLERKVRGMKEWETEEEIRGEYFFSRFNIPVFNSPDFTPGHRHNNKENKSYNDWLIEGNNFKNNWKEKIKHVEFAYGLWLDRNFTNQNI